MGQGEMPWITDEIAHRKHAIEMLKSGVGPVAVSELCGVSRQTLHKWQRRYRVSGSRGLVELSRAPKHHPQVVSDEMKRRIGQVRRKTKEGPKKIRIYLEGLNLEEKVPSASTIGLILKAKGLSKPASKRRHAPKPEGPRRLTEAQAPNDVWTIDFKGEFSVGRSTCYPLTVQDRFSRAILAIKGETGTYTEATNSQMWRLFREHGLPSVIRCDNGTPFISTQSPAGLTQVSSVWVRLGIVTERTLPATPSENGRHERFHRTLKKHTANPPANTFGAQQKRFDRYRKHFNYVRPHEALEMKTPISFYEASPRSCPALLPEIEHSNAQHILGIYADGGAMYRGSRFYLGRAFANQTVGLVEKADDIYTISYGPVYLGFLNLRSKEGRFHQAP